jgi:hypothetical protein
VWAGGSVEFVNFRDGGGEVTIADAGWPAKALRSRISYSAQATRRRSAATGRFISWQEGMVAPWFAVLHPYVPVQPIWPGFAVDAALFGSAWWAIFSNAALVLVTRRRLRWSRGRCGECGYDLSGAAGMCPECGKAVGAKA